MSSTTQTATAPALPTPEFDLLDMNNYTLAKLPVLKPTRISAIMKAAGLPVAALVFSLLHFQAFTIQGFENQYLMEPSYLYSAVAIFTAALILWITESIPSYLTSFMAIVAIILTNVLTMRQAFAFMGEPVMILNIASFAMASGLVATGVAKRLALKLVTRFIGNINTVFFAFIAVNMILGAFISATSAKTALILPIFMVCSAVFGATGGEYRNNVGKNMVLQNLAANNISAGGFMTGASANLVAAMLIQDALALQGAGASFYYADWLLIMWPVSAIQAAFAWWVGTRVIFPISKEDAKPKLEGGKERLQAELDKLGPIKASEIRATIIFLAVLAFWATDRFHGIRAEVIAVMGATVMLMPALAKRIPRIGVINWNDVDIPWHMLLFSWGAYAIGGVINRTNVMGVFTYWLFDALGVTEATPKLVLFMGLSAFFGLMSLVNQSKTARTMIMFPLLIATAVQFGWCIVGFTLPMTVFIMTVYALYFNSKPANISYLTAMYTTGESFKFGMVNMLFVWLLIVPWTHFVMPLFGYASQLW